MKPNPLLILAAFGAILSASSAMGQIQRIGSDIQAAPTPQFGTAPPVTKTQNPLQATPQGSPVPGASMPVPMPQGQPGGRLDLVEEGLNRVAPMTNEEIIRFRTELNRRSAASTQPLSAQAKPTMRVAQMEVGPGASPEVIRITMTEGATVTFMDAAGRPWKVEGADNFNTSGIDIGRAGQFAIVISAKSQETVGNISVRLEGLLSPVSLKVIAGTGIREVDYAVAMQIPRYVPGLPIPINASVERTPLATAELLNYLLKTPPRGATALTIEGIDGAMAWQTPTGRLILRTEHLVANYARRQSSFDGMSVYEMSMTPFVLVSVDGRLLSARVSGFSIVQEGQR